MKTQEIAVTGEGNAPRVNVAPTGEVFRLVDHQNNDGTCGAHDESLGMVEDILAQRNELLAALKELRRAYKDTTSCASDYAIAFVAAQRHADQAIANAEKGKQ